MSKDHLIFPMPEENCRLCSLTADKYQMENELAFVYRPTRPAALFHTLIVLKRHVASYFDITPQEAAAVHELLMKQEQALEEQDETITGFNIGINCGESAGQTVPHVCVHLIPRRTGDVTDPRGGVRTILPWDSQF